MKIKKLLWAAQAFFKIKILHKRIPFIVGWAVTDRCNRRCLYCGRWQGRIKELTTTQAFQIIDQLAELGTWKISFTGGEPLLRDDIGPIIDRCHARGIETKLNSNGALVKRKIQELKNLDALCLSLDGPESVHDLLRGEGSYREVIEAAEAARMNGLKLSFATVLTKCNCDKLAEIIKTASYFDSQVLFQPATLRVLGEDQRNAWIPSIEQYSLATHDLIKRKSQGDKTIANSIAGLKYLLQWPNVWRSTCSSGWISCRIEPNGDMVYCSRSRLDFTALNCARDGVKRAFDHLAPITCNQCECAGRVELNLIFSGGFKMLYDQMRNA